MKNNPGLKFQLTSQPFKDHQIPSEWLHWMNFYDYKYKQDPFKRVLWLGVCYLF